MYHMFSFGMFLLWSQSHYIRIEITDPDEADEEMACLNRTILELKLLCN